MQDPEENKKPGNKIRPVPHPANHDLLVEIMENISDAFVAIDKNWHYVYVNNKAGEMFGREPADLVGKHVWTEFPEGVGQRFYQAYHEAMEKEIPIEIEEYYPPWEKWFENRIQPYKEGLLIFFQDITERKVKELNIIRLNSLLTESQHIGKMGTWVWDIVNDTGWMSTTMYELFGIFKTDKAITLREFVRFIHPEDQERMKKMIFKRIREPKDFCTEFRIINKAGQTRFFRTQAKLHYDQFRDPEKLIGIIIDITETELDKLKIRDFNKDLEKRVKERTIELELAESKMKALIENTTDGIWAVNRNKELIIFNTAFENTYKTIKGERLQIGKRLDEILDPVADKDEYDYWNALVERTLKGESFTEIYVVPVGPKITFIVSCHPITVNDEIIGSTFFSHDITMMKMHEEKITMLNNKLSEKVDELKEINEDLNSFTYSVSHDLRSPLRAINGLSGMLMSHIGDTIEPDDRLLIERIISNATKLENLIQDLLSFSRVTRKDLIRNKVDMNSLVTSVAREVKDNMNINADIIKIHDMPEVSADYALLSQVFYNLISNAIKFSSKVDKPFIEIGAEKTGKDDVFYVKDNGTGFDMKYADKIFEVFQRLHTEAEFEGTGVGLAIVKKIISRHNGKIWVDSHPGKGATFYFTVEGPLQKNE